MRAETSNSRERALQFERNPAPDAAPSPKRRRQRPGSLRVRAPDSIQNATQATDQSLTPSVFRDKSLASDGNMGAELGQAVQGGRQHRYYNAATGVTTTKLRLAQAQRPSRLLFHAAATPAQFSKSKLQDCNQENDEDNAGVAALHRSEEAGEAGAKAAHATMQKHRSRVRGSAVREAKRDGYAYSSNPLSRKMQKRKIQQAYAAAKRGKPAADFSWATRMRESIKSTLKNAGKYVARKAGKAGLVVLGFGGLLTFLLSSLTSCGSVSSGLGSAVGSAAGVVAAGTYLSEDAEMLAAEAAYCQMEADLQASLDNYESTHDYDEYEYNLDEIGHDPYVLISLISSYYEGAWTLDQVQYSLEEIFKRQYILTETVREETRTVTTTKTETQIVTDPETGEEHEEEVEIEVEEEVTVRVCSVSLDNFNLSHVPVYMLTEAQIEQYATYMCSLGYRPDLFPDSAYVSLYDSEGLSGYEIPTDALADETFNAMMEEATQYIGYPYVWGGASPQTSFDCSGFVSWVINHSGWNVGRLSAQGLCNICTRTSTPHPGDLVFFKGTYDTSEVSHVGIYVGNNMMLHCGDPIDYADLTSNYWQQHFYCYGKLP